MPNSALQDAEYLMDCLCYLLRPDLFYSLATQALRMGWLFVNDLARAHLKHLVSALICSYKQRIMKTYRPSQPPPLKPLTRQNYLFTQELLAGAYIREDLAKLSNLPAELFTFKEVISNSRLEFRKGELYYHSKAPHYGEINLSKRMLRNRSFPTLFRLAESDGGKLEA